MTHFEKIARTPEALASWLDEHMEICDEISCNECVLYEPCWKQGGIDTGEYPEFTNARLWFEWLTREE